MLYLRANETKFLFDMFALSIFIETQMCLYSFIQRLQNFLSLDLNNHYL